MFQFPGFALSHESTWSSTKWVAPFRYARINSCLQIPEPFRSLPRLSSPPDSLGILRSLFFSFSLVLPPLARHPHCESHISMLLLLPIEIVVRKFRIKIYRLNSIFCFTSNLFSQYCQWTTPLQTGLQRYKLFLTWQIFSTLFSTFF